MSWLPLDLLLSQFVEELLTQVLKLPIGNKRKTPLKGTSLLKLQETLDPSKVKYIILDEISMCGQPQLAFIDDRLRQASGQLDQPAGGYNVILIGDQAQLPPVGDTRLFVEPTNDHTKKLQG